MTFIDTQILDTQIVAGRLLPILLSGKPVSRTMVTALMQHGPNTHLPLIMRYLRRNYKIIINYSPKNGGCWFMTPENIFEYLTAPEQQAARKKKMDTERSKRRLENSIIYMAREYKYELTKIMRPSLQPQLLNKK